MLIVSPFFLADAHASGRDSRFLAPQGQRYVSPGQSEAAQPWSDALGESSSFMIGREDRFHAVVVLTRPKQNAVEFGLGSLPYDGLSLARPWRGNVSQTQAGETTRTSRFLSLG